MLGLAYDVTEDADFVVPNDVLEIAADTAPARIISAISIGIILFLI